MNAKKTKTTVAHDVDDYLARLPEDSRLALEKLRSTIKSVVPDSVEVISYQIPTFKYQGRMLVSYAAFSEHCSFFPGTNRSSPERVEVVSDLERYDSFYAHPALAGVTHKKAR